MHIPSSIFSSSEHAGFLGGGQYSGSGWVRLTGTLTCTTWSWRPRSAERYEPSCGWNVVFGDAKCRICDIWTFQNIIFGWHWSRLFWQFLRTCMRGHFLLLCMRRGSIVQTDPGPKAILQAAGGVGFGGGRARAGVGRESSRVSQQRVPSLNYLSEPISTRCTK